MEEIPDVSQYENKPTIYVDLAIYSGKPDENPDKNFLITKHIKTVTAQAMEKTGLFSAYSFDINKVRSTDYTIKIKVYSYGNKFAAFLSGFLSGFSFGVIPGTAIDHFTVSVEAVDSNGKILSKQVNNDAIQTWVGIWFIPFMGNTIHKAVSNTLENQIVTALIELFNEKIFQYSLNNHFVFAS
jgi:hypothetical protein